MVKIAQQCAGQCKDNATCNHLTGQCDSGCADGWTGENCSKGNKERERDRLKLREREKKRLRGR